ncbi:MULTISPECIES: glutamic-type intramembrane protease PrsW [Bacillaceae]|uniref:glutamic-type intramembrane protease PrsW n=1 Tax=Bacillaceae TaxID=186817 RepID=UPI0011A7AB3E|nr:MULTISPECIES: glutamic-type intramembrane protease PrsW [Bacillaceae]MED4474777.1 glutamic-type intramembrane protease PrsW [Oceanobacillus caeni]
MVGLLSAGLAPAFAIMSFIYLKDRFTEPISLIIKMFISGALLVFPIMFIQYALNAENLTNSHFIQSFFFVALLEEFSKWFLFIYMIYHHEEFDDHYDGIVYAVAISLGFASLENILYLLTNGIEYAFLRAFFPVSSHALFGVIMGYYFGKAKVIDYHTNWNRIFAFLFPFLLHGVYNYILIGISSHWTYYLIPFMIILWLIALHRIKVANQVTFL